MIHLEISGRTDLRNIHIQSVCMVYFVLCRRFIITRGVTIYSAHKTIHDIGFTRTRLDFNTFFLKTLLMKYMTGKIIF